jgi:gamma-glutamylcyclotransferase (GGCT)/AIG2-like uncharacterized protein YtfP
MRNHHRIADQTFIADVFTQPFYRLLHLGAFPGLIEVPSNGIAVRGELWAVDSAKLAQLDEFEGAPHLFTRRAVRLQDSAVRADAYFYAGHPRDFSDCSERWSDQSPSTSSIE